MTDRDALLAAIRAAPHDDTPRLIYADWLDEHGEAVGCRWCGGSGQEPRPQPVRLPDGKAYVYVGPDGPCYACSGLGRVDDGRHDRAEFIRVQCELAGLDDHPAFAAICAGVQCEVCDRKAELHRRSLRLQTYPPGRFDEWCRPLDRSAGGGFEVAFRRGFVDRVECAAADWLEHADAILAAHPVTAVRLTAWPPVAVARDPERRAHTFRVIAPGRDCPPVVLTEAQLLRIDHTPGPSVDPVPAMVAEAARRAAELFARANWPGVAFRLPDQPPLIDRYRFGLESWLPRFEWPLDGPAGFDTLLPTDYSEATALLAAEHARLLGGSGIPTPRVPTPRADLDRLRDRTLRDAGPR